VPVLITLLLILNLVNASEINDADSIKCPNFYSINLESTKLESIHINECTIGKISFYNTSKEIKKKLKVFHKKPKKNGRLFFGFAKYLNQISINFYRDGKQIQSINNFKENEWIVLRGRYKFIAINAPGKKINILEDFIEINWDQEKNDRVNIISGNQRDLQKFGVINPNFLSVFVHEFVSFLENIMNFLYKISLNSWGLTILLYAFLSKLIFMPISYKSWLWKEVSLIQKKSLDKKLMNIKNNFTGEEAYQKTVESYRELNLSFFYQMKPLIGFFIQLPFLILSFIMIAGFSEFNKEEFLWIKDLSYSDNFFQLPFYIPFFGNEFNLLPFLMILAPLFFLKIFNQKKNRNQKNVSQKLIAIALVFIFYNFPSSMVIFWTSSSLLAVLQDYIFQKYFGGR